MNHSIKLLLSCCLFIMLATVVSCKKSDPAPAPDPKTILMNKTWKITAITVNPAYNDTTDIYADLDECEKDDLYQFNTNDVFLMKEITKCDPSDADSLTGTWNYDDDRKILKLKNSYPGASYDLEYLVSEITDNYFKLKIGFTENGTAYSWTYTFQKQ